MRWKQPPPIKVYEALGCVADGRIILDGMTAMVFSSSRNKQYTVTYDADRHAIMANDNGSYWQSYLGYPAIAYLVQANVISCDQAAAVALKNIPWKDINTKYKNVFEKTLGEVQTIVTHRGYDTKVIEHAVDEILQQVENLHLVQLGPRVKPPTGY